MSETCRQSESNILAGINLLDPNTFIHGVPHQIFRRLRQEAPFSWHEEPNGPGFWVVTTHTDICTISRDPARFVSSRGTLIKDSPPERLPLERLSILNMDPPKHSEYKRVVWEAFRRRSKQLDRDVGRAVRRLIDGIAGSGGCDFATGIAAQLPMQVLAEMLQVPIEEQGIFVRWNDLLRQHDDPESSDAHGDALYEVASEMCAYIKERAYALGSPNSDMVDRCLQAELDAHFIVNAVAGNEPTRNLISGALQALLEHPEQKLQLIENPALWDLGIEELCRWVTPAMYFRRTAIESVELRGQRIQAGDKLALYYISANRDAEVFRDPDRLDVSRSPNPHLAMGVGEHYCIGAYLGRIQARRLFQELFLRLPDIKLDGPVERTHSTFMNGIKRLPVTFTPNCRRTAAGSPGKD